MNRRYEFFFAVLLSVSGGAVQAGITFGQNGGFVVVDGAGLDCGSVHLADGFIQNRSGTITGSPSCNRMAIETAVDATHRFMMVTGEVQLGVGITLGNNQVLTMDGSPIAEAILVSGGFESPSVLNGVAGTISGNVLLESGVALSIDLAGTLNADIVLNANADEEVHVVLEKDLAMGPGYMLKPGLSAGSKRLLCNGHRLYVGGSSGVPCFLANTLMVSHAAVCLEGPLVCQEGSYLYFETDGFVEGGGNTIQCNVGTCFDNGGNTVRFSNVTFSHISGSHFYGSGSWIFENCRMEKSDGTALILNATALDTGLDIFGEEGAAFTSGTISLQSNVVLMGRWTCGIADVLDPQPVVTINGNGYSLDMAGSGWGIATGSFNILEGSVLRLHDVFVKNLLPDSLVDSYSSLAFSDVTFSLQANIDWSARGVVLRAEGPATFITGNYSFVASEPSSLGADVTLWVDSVGGSGTVSGFSTDVGRIATVGSVGDLASLHADIVELQGQVSDLGGGLPSYTFNALSSPCGLLHDIHLYAPQSDGSSGSSLVFNGEGSFFFDGYGRTVHFGQPSLTGSFPTLMVVAVDTVVEMQHIVLDGLSNTNHEKAGSLFFGTGTTVRLNTDLIGIERLSKSLVFGSAGESIGSVSTLDLNGHTLDMSHDDALISLVNSAGAELHIRNGRIINLSGSKIVAGYGMLIAFHDVSLEFSDDFNWSSLEGDGYTARLTFDGKCSLTGVSDSCFFNHSNGDLVITSGSTLRIGDRVVYNHCNAGVANIVMESDASVLELVGTTFKHPDQAEVGPLVLSGGTLICDQRVRFVPGSAGISFGLETDIPELNRYLNIILRPGAQCVVSNDLDTSAGQLYYANAEVAG